MAYVGWKTMMLDGKFGVEISEDGTLSVKVLMLTLEDGI